MSDRTHRTGPEMRANRCPAGGECQRQCRDRHDRCELRLLEYVDKSDMPGGMPIAYWGSKHEPFPQDDYAIVKAAAEKALETMDDAQKIIENRENTHGNYDTQAIRARQIKDTISSADRERQATGMSRLTAAQHEALDMIAVKISRIICGNPNEPDHWLDIAGYATLVHNMLTTGKHLGDTTT